MLRFASLGSLAPAALLATLAAGCSSTPSVTGDAGGAVPDASDQHCIVDGGLATQKVGMCLMSTPGGADAGALDAAADDGAPPPTVDYGATLYNSAGYDDDCKYSVSFTSTPVRKGAEVTFTVNVAALDPAGPSSGAHVYAEVYLTNIHPTPSSNTNTVEVSPGVYTVGPIVFDASGLWTVRFHFYEMCSDVPTDSPHGHAAFYIDVP